jgi:predicted phage terminase large subunit-like protein
VKIFNSGRLNSAQLLPIARRDFAVYCSALYPKFQLPRHLELLIEKLEAVERGEIKRLMVSMPPRHGKSLTATQLFPPWFIGRNPARSVAVCTYGEALAQDLGRKVFRTISDPLHRRVFPDCRLATDVGAAERFETEAGGSFFSVSRQGALTGRGCDLLVIDDLLKDAQEASSAATKKLVKDFYERVALTRLTPDGAIVLVGTRWGKNDLFDFLLIEKGETQWDVLNLSAIAEGSDPLGRAEGEALWPERYSVKHLAQKRFEMGSAGFVTLYQGRPSESDGLIFRREWFRTYTQLPQLKRTIVSLDSAFKTGQSNDYSAIQVWAEGQTGFYLLARWKGKVEFPELKRVLISVCDQWKPEECLIEDAASGQSLLQELQSSTSLPLKPIKPDRDKEARAQSCTGIAEAGRIFLPADAAWLSEFMDELCGFPNMPHDDEVDAATQALNFLRGDGESVFGWIEYLKDVIAGRRRNPLDDPGPQEFRDAGGNPIANLREDNLNKAANYELEKKLRGLDKVTTLNPATKKAWEQNPTPPCPKCKSSSVRIGGGGNRCSQCGLQFDRPGEEPEVTFMGRYGPVVRRMPR